MLVTTRSIGNMQCTICLDELSAEQALMFKCKCKGSSRVTVCEGCARRYVERFGEVRMVLKNGECIDIDKASVACMVCRAPARGCPRFSAVVRDREKQARGVLLHLRAASVAARYHLTMTAAACAIGMVAVFLVLDPTCYCECHRSEYD